ncbi:hypothetical protein EIP86_003224 [Pleurotus ostreatoroseus]|nr:hypothetical protein EIP86_003224 [Pleurotus ostreatoroseus]
MASLIAILDLKGKPLIQRSYRDDVPPSYIEKFLPIILELEEDNQQVTPCFTREGVNYMHIRHSNLYLLALSKRNSNAAESILFLHRLTQVLVEYFKELEEESIRDNFVIIYELLDEMMDFGFPQTTESKILQEYITQESYKLEVQVRPPIAVTNAVSWRSEGIRYRKNEVFLDVIESVNLLVNANGNVVRSEILGAIKMKCYLSGMPELRLGLNDKVMFESTGRTSRGKAIEMEDVKFHQCVRLSRFENDRTISFIPPDGEFELMSYRLSTPVKPLVWVEAAVEHHKGSRVEYMVKVKAQFKRRSTANNVEIYVPVPDDADTPKFRASTGSVQYAPDKSAFVWKIKQLGGGREFLMRAHFGLPSVRGDQESLDKRAPITVKFEIPYFTVSGIQVRYLKIVEKSGYQALPWVRYITQNGDDYSFDCTRDHKDRPHDLDDPGTRCGAWSTGMASLIAILDLKGKSLIQRSYRDDVSPTYIERFLSYILEMEDEGTQEVPCFSREGVNYLHIRHSNLYSALSLYLCLRAGFPNFGLPELEEESIRDNFVIIYELLDEMMDFGYPQITDGKMLQEYITQESYKLESMALARPVTDVTNAVSWRSQGIKYRKNEVFLDVIESVNLLVNASGVVVRSEILGAIKMKCYLSGMPELRLGLNDKVMFDTTGQTARGRAIEMEDAKFHQCVRLSRFEIDRTISFIPPDGEFELMSYRISTPVKPLVWAEATVEQRGSRLEYLVTVKAQFKRKSSASEVEIAVPVPEDVDSPKFRAASGRATYVPARAAFVWKLKGLAGGSEYLLRAHFGLPSVRGEAEADPANAPHKRTPITVEFEIPYFTVSGIQVRYLKVVEKSGYQAMPWVRYITQNGDDYSLRTAVDNGGAPLAAL